MMVAPPCAGPGQPQPAPARALRPLAGYLAAGATGYLDCFIREASVAPIPAFSVHTRVHGGSPCTVEAPFPTPGGRYSVVAQAHLTSAPAWALPAAVTHAFTLSAGTATNHCSAVL